MASISKWPKCSWSQVLEEMSKRGVKYMKVGTEVKVQIEAKHIKVVSQPNKQIN